MPSIEHGGRGCGFDQLFGLSLGAGDERILYPTAPRRDAQASFWTPTKRLAHRPDFPLTAQINLHHLRVHF